MREYLEYIAQFRKSMGFYRITELSAEPTAGARLIQGHWMHTGRTSGRNLNRESLRSEVS